MTQGNQIIDGTNPIFTSAAMKYCIIIFHCTSLSTGDQTNGNRICRFDKLYRRNNQKNWRLSEI